MWFQDQDRAKSTREGDHCFIRARTELAAAGVKAGVWWHLCRSCGMTVAQDGSLNPAKCRKGIMEEDFQKWADKPCGGLEARSRGSWEPDSTGATPRDMEAWKKEYEKVVKTSLTKSKVKQAMAKQAQLIRYKQAVRWYDAHKRFWEKTENQRVGGGSNASHGGA